MIISKTVKDKEVKRLAKLIWNCIVSIVFLLLLTLVFGDSGDVILYLFIGIISLRAIVNIITFKGDLKRAEYEYRAKIQREKLKEQQERYNRMWEENQRQQRQQARNRNGREYSNWDNYFRDFQQKYDPNNNQWNNRKRATTVITPDKEKLNKAAQLMGINLLTDSNDVIKKKYRTLAMKYHPDKYSTDTDRIKKIANRNFQKLNNAYELIKKHKNIN